MRKFLRILSIILLICWMGLIFFLSSQTADVSSQTSGRIIEAVAEKIYPDFEQLTYEEQQNVVASFQFTVRKATHIVIFAVLGFFAFLSFVSYVNLRFFTRMFWASGISLLYAASDEFHQRFVVGRSCELRDFALDTIGILAAILICSLFVKIIPPLRRKTAFAGNSKKSLINLNNELFVKLDNSLGENRRLEEEITRQNKLIEDLENKLQWKAEENIVCQESICEETEEDEIPHEVGIDTEIVTENEEMKLSDEKEYAAKVIGSAVVEVTRVCNKITAESCDENCKELVNLALGRNEVLKSQILKILSGEQSFEEKKVLIEKERKDAFDYFDSILAQMR